MIDITTIGWLTIDDIVLTDGTCRQGVRGGGALYSAVGAHLWNPKVGLHSVAGKPYYSDTCNQIKARGIDTSSIKCSEGNGLELWLLHENEVHKQQIPKLSSSNALDLDIDRGPVAGVHAQAKGFHIAPQGPASSVANARHLASLDHSPLITMDILADDFIDSSAYRDLSFLQHITAFMPSEAEIARIWGPSSIEGWLKENSVRYRCHMVAKLGKRGALVCEASTGALIHVPSFSTRALDTTGAGDSFCGGFIAGLVAGKTLDVCAAMGTVSASYVIEAYGALATYHPTDEERRSRLEQVQSGVKAIAY